MKYTKVAFKNIGPIESGQIRHKKISVLFGPNNSGKSIAASLIHGVCQLNSAPNAMQADLLRGVRVSAKDRECISKYMYGQKILYIAGIPWNRIVTANKKSCALKIHSSKKSPLEINFRRPKLNMNQFNTLDALKAVGRQNTNSFYVPAGRTGAIQYFMWIYRAKNTLFRYMLDTFMRSPSTNGSNRAGKKHEQSISMPEHPERLYDLIMQEDKLTEEVQDMFSALFEGSVRMGSRNGIPRIMYVDPSGFETEIEHAGSGTVSSLPIMMSLQYVDDGGTLVIEEPEAHLEPVRQMKLVEKLVAFAAHRRISLIFSTQSDYVLKKLLTMTVSKKIKQKDLGLYYFKRTPGNFTHIEEFVADEDGEIPRDMFDDAIDSLVEEISS